MFAATDISRFPFAVAALVSILVAAVAPKGKRISAFLGCMFAGLGIIFLAAGRVPQRWHAGPPLEGPLATAGSVVMIAFGACAILLAFIRRQAKDDSRHDDQQT